MSLEDLERGTGRPDQGDQEFKPGDKMLAAGDFEMGKTTGLGYIAEGYGRTLVHDPEGELDPADPPPTIRPESWEIVASVDEIPEANAPCVSVNVDYTELDAVCEVALANSELLDLLVLLEFSNAVPGTSPSATPKHVSTAWRTLHKDDVSIAAEIHRSSEIPKICRRAKHVLSWRIPEDDAKDLAEIAGIDELALACRLPQYHYLHAVGSSSLTWRKPFPLHPPPR